MRRVERSNRGIWDNAYEILDRLVQDDLPPELADAVRTMSGILDPANSLDEKAEKIAQFLPGMFFHVYDDAHGWNDDAMRELADAQRDASELARESRSAMGTGPSSKS